MAKRSVPAQRLLESLCRATQSAPRSLRHRMLSAARGAWVRRSDPDVVVDICGSRVRVPLSHELPVYLAAHREYSMNLGRIAGHVASSHPDRSVIDIGANVGDSVAIIRPHSKAPILCIEGDATFLPYLEANIAQDPFVAVEPSYVATSDTASRYAVERVGGTARLVPTTAGVAADEDDSVQAESLLDLLARHPAHSSPALIKIDTDGNDPGIIKAAAPLLREHHPTLFFEFDPRLVEQASGTDGTEIFELLDDLGYTDAIFFANTGELLCRLRPSDKALIHDLAEASGPDGPLEYYDVCVVHGDDHALAAAIYDDEHARRRHARANSPDGDLSRAGRRPRASRP